ncbi:AAA family ATPase [Rhizobiaceae bacterium n13]|uniref:AAA family ATPase n=1 Tax=Ferirhizobium litorale TaxID=2927786 RepID=UPI0024B31691|nr:AAA family ATPase [Fererhizobium litorale]MDI7864116.1 AAA family ATPase [Fererhizobium litorale]
MNISRNRQGFALPEYIAYASVCRAIRAYERAGRFAVALVLPRWEDKGTYLRAAAALLNPLGDFQIPDRVYIGDDKPETYDTILDDFANHKTIVLFKNADDIPDEITVAFDAVLQVELPSIRQVQGVVKWVYKLDITPEEAEVLVCSNWRRLKLAVVRGRPMSRVLATLRERRKSSTPRAPKRNRPIDEATTLEPMEGYGEAKRWGLDLARDIADWRSGSLAWDDVDRGILLSGPSGVGKTIFSRALAATCKVELVFASYAKWQAKGHLGDFLKAMQASFAEARKKAPAILFIDELDAFGDRSTVVGDNASYDIKATNGLLEQLDGLEGREGVVVVGACNNPQWIDPAIIRPGRLDRHVRIPLPDTEARAAIFRMHLRGDLTDVDHRAFAEATDGMTGATIQQIVRDARRSARRGRRPVTAADVILHVPPLVVVPPEVVRVNAVHEIGHAVVGAVLGMKLSSVSVALTLRFGQLAQSVGRAVFARDVWARRTKDYYLDTIAMTMSGMAAEQLLLGSWDDGAAGGVGSDLHEATKTAIALERSFGMGRKLASYGPVDDRDTNEMKLLDTALMSEVDGILRKQLKRSMAILERHREMCLKLVDELVERGELPGMEVLEALAEDHTEDDDVRKGCDRMSGGALPG